MEPHDSELGVMAQEYIQPSLVAQRGHDYQEKGTATRRFELLRGGSASVPKPTLRLIKREVPATVTSLPLRLAAPRRREVAVNTYDLHYA